MATGFNFSQTFERLQLSDEVRTPKGSDERPASWGSNEVRTSRGSDEIPTPTGFCLSQTLARGSDECFDTCCCTCLEDRRYKEANKYCRNCALYYCEQCLRTHNKIPSSRGHVVVDTKGSYTICDDQTELPTERCAIHTGKVVDMYCGDHDIVCCSECIAVIHRSCAKLARIQDVAKGIRSSAEYMWVKNSFQQALSRLQEIKDEKLQEMSSLEGRTKELLNEISNMEEELKARVSMLAQNSRHKLEAAFTEKKRDINNSIGKLNSAIVILSEKEGQLTEGNDAQVLDNVKTGKVIMEEAQQMMKNMTHNKEYKRMRFIPYIGLRKVLTEVDALGSINVKMEENISAINVKAYRATVCKKFKDLRGVTAICCFDENTLLLGNGKKLQKLNPNDFSITEQLNVTDHVTSLCKVGSQRVAVALGDFNEIQFVSLEPSMMLVDQLHTDHPCHKLAYNKETEELLVNTRHKEIKVYDTMGTCLRSITFPESDLIESILHGGSVKSMAMSDDSSTIYALRGTCVHALSATGDLLSTFGGLPRSLSGGNICVLPGNIILVSGDFGVVQLNQQGKQLGMCIRGFQIGGLAYDRTRSRLFVSESFEGLAVYNVQALQR